MLFLINDPGDHLCPHRAKERKWSTKISTSWTIKKNWETEAKPESILGATSFTAPTICGIVPAGFAAKEKKVKTNLAANEDTRDKNNKKGTKKKFRYQPFAGEVAGEPITLTRL
jgi:hypothetical protein